MPAELARAERNAKILLDAAFTSAYSAGSLLPMPTEVILRDKLRAGVVPGPRTAPLPAWSATTIRNDETDISRTGLAGPGRVPRLRGRTSRHGFRQREVFAQQRRRVHPWRLADNPVHAGRSSAAGEQARESGVRLNCHAQSAESVKVAVRAGFRSIYHCTYADEEALDLLSRSKTSPSCRRSRHHLRQCLRGRGVRDYPPAGRVHGFGRGARRHGDRLSRDPQARDSRFARG